MLWAGIALLVMGVPWALFKGWVAWSVSRDLHHGEGTPTLDLPIFCPIPLAAGAHMAASALGRQPFPGFGLVVYVVLAAGFGVLLWWIDRAGEPERQRQLAAIRDRRPPEAPDTGTINGPSNNEGLR